MENYNVKCIKKYINIIGGFFVIEVGEEVRVEFFDDEELFVINGIPFGKNEFFNHFIIN